MLYIGVPMFTCCRSISLTHCPDQISCKLRIRRFRIFLPWRSAWTSSGSGSRRRCCRHRNVFRLNKNSHSLKMYPEFSYQVHLKIANTLEELSKSNLNKNINLCPIYHKQIEIHLSMLDNHIKKVSSRFVCAFHPLVLDWNPKLFIIQLILFLRLWKEWELK